jgi:hypothetical protein
MASRQKGEYVPAIVWRLVGHPLVLLGVYFLFAASFFAHGLVIWEDPLQRAAALLVGGAFVVLPAIVVRRGAFTSRVVVELRFERAKERVLTVTDRGRLATPKVLMQHGGVELDLASTVARELKIWTHRLLPTGDSESVNARVEVESTSFDVNGQAIVPFGAGARRVRIEL